MRMFKIMEIITIAIIMAALIITLWMGWIDFKLWILPDELVATLGVLAIAFHASLQWEMGGVLTLFFGALMGGGTLYIIRAIANRIYGFETLGLGDIKLMSAVGLWLGPHDVLIAMGIGALCGVCHALIIAYQTKQPLGGMMLPAGPGFITGSLFTALWHFMTFYGGF